MSARDPLPDLPLDNVVAGATATAVQSLNLAQLQAVFALSPGGLVVQDGTGHIVDCNQNAERLLGLTRAQMRGLSSVDPRWRAIDSDGADLPGDQHPSMRTLRTGQPVTDFLMGVCLPDGQRRWLRVSTSLLPTEQGPWVVASFTDTTAAHRLQGKLAGQWQRLRATLEGSRTATWEWNVQTGEVRVDARWAEIVGLTLKDLEPLSIDTLLRLVHPGDRPLCEQLVKRHFRGEVSYYDIEFRVCHRDTSWRWVHCRGRLSSTTLDGRPLWMYGTHEDVTARKQAELMAQEARQMLQALFDLSPVGIALINQRTGRLDRVNPALENMVGWTADELSAYPPVVPLSPTYLAFRLARQQELQLHGRFDPQETQLRRRDGHMLDVTVCGAAFTADNGAPYVWTVTQDISSRKTLERALREAATQDPLTGLPNRSALNEALEQAATLARAPAQPQPFALLFLDFDRFKLVNDTLGHAAGDQLLKAVATRLSLGLPAGWCESTLLARFGGDEFVLLVPGLQTEAEAQDLGERLLAALEQPYKVHGKTIRSSASIGVAFSQGPGTNAADMLRDADIAMYEAKHQGRGRMVLFNDDMRDRLSRAVQIESALHQALALQQMHLVYQPIVDLDNGQMSSVEALLRWQHPELGPVSPAEFIPIAEESGHVSALGEWVLRQACLQWARWQAEDAAAAPAMVSVNLSRVQLSLGERLLALVQTALQDAGMPTCALQLEITEREVSHQATGTRELLQALRDQGVKLAMDDFGTGASSLGCLREFPFDVIKIDKSFVTDLCRDPHVLAVAHATVQVIENLGMVSVAEGIEEPDELATLQALGCRYGQGYLFGRPMAPEALLSTMRRRG